MRQKRVDAFVGPFFLANVGTARAEPAARKAPAPTAEKHDAGVPGEIEKAADKLVEQYVPMP